MRALRVALVLVVRLAALMVQASRAALRAVACDMCP